MMDTLIPIFDVLYQPQAWFLGLSPYISMTIVGLIVAITLACAGFLLARLGYKPLWGLLLIVPTVSVVGLWVLALKQFPLEKLRR